MKNFLKLLYLHTNIFIKTFIAIISILLFSKTKAVKALIRIQKKIKQSKSCVILGNGPSLTKEIRNSFDKLLDSELFVVNSFVRSEFFVSLKPRHYLYIDPDLWRDNVNEKSKKERDYVLNAISSITDWEMFFYIPLEAYRSKRIRNLFKSNSNITLVPINVVPLEGYRKVIHYLFKLNLGMPRPQNVLIAALFVSINLGFKEIYLFGCDHSWIENICVNKNNQVCIKDVHFYDQTMTELIPWVKAEENNSTYTMHEVLSFFTHTFKSHHQIRSYADEMSARIINITDNSYIDAYERGVF